MTVNGFKIPFGDDVNILKSDYGDGCTTLHIYEKPINYTLNGGSFTFVNYII